MINFILRSVAVVLDAICTYLLFKWFFTPMTNIKLDIAQIFGLQMLLRHTILPEKLIDSVSTTKEREPFVSIVVPFIITLFGWLFYCIHMGAWTY